MIPEVTCSGATSITDTSVVLVGGSVDATPDQYVRFSYGDYTGVYSTSTDIFYADSHFNYQVNDLDPETEYFYVTELLDTDGVSVLASSSECMFVTEKSTTLSDEDEGGDDTSNTGTSPQQSSFMGDMPSVPKSDLISCLKTLPVNQGMFFDFSNYFFHNCAKFPVLTYKKLFKRR
jgi:hypothetical protein